MGLPRPTGLSALSLPQGLFPAGPAHCGGTSAPFSPPRRKGSAGTGEIGPQRAAHAMRVPQLPASASRLPPPRHGQQQPQ